MRTLIVDIETVGLPLDEAQKKVLTRNTETAEEYAEELGKAALWPVTGKVVCIGLMDFDTKEKFIDVRVDERGLLAWFWDSVVKYNRIVTFNGRGFDIPFLMFRSAANDVQITRRDLVGYRYAAHPHCDLLDQLSFYGATRKHTLDMYCRALGIPSPKEHVDGGGVEMLWNDKNFGAIGAYNGLDLEAEAMLYAKWLKYYAA